MFRCILSVVAIALTSPLVSFADPGPTAPLFRRAAPARSTPAQPATKPKEKLDVPEPFSPPAEALAANVTQESTGGAEVDVEEVLRLGDRVTRVGRGPMGGADRAIGDAMSPPPDDSHKWFFTVVIERGDRESDTLLYDMKHSAELRAWANPDEPKDSWAHVNVYVKGDESQDWRFKALRITKYPCMVLQPPAKLVDDADPKSWEWGDPATVVWQWDGYDATLPARDKLRADAIRKAVTAYAVKFSENRQRLASAPPPTPGSKQVAKPSDETGAPPLPVMPGTPGGGIFAPNPIAPSAGGQQPTAPQGGLSLLLEALGLLGTGTGLNNILMMTLIGVQLWRTMRKSTGQATLLDDASFAALIDALKSLTGQRSTPSQ